MNYYGPRQRADGRWNYTIKNEGEKLPHAIGYCYAYRPWDAGDAARYGISEHALQAEAATSHKHHTDGHATPGQANLCYKEWLLDHAARYEARLFSTTVRPCAVCGKGTTGMVLVQGWPKASLCDEHRDPEHFARVFVVGKSFGSE